MSCNFSHPFKRMRKPCGCEVNVDEDLVPLMELIWAHGWEVHGSCQESWDGYVWLEISAVDAEDFLNTVLEHISEPLRGNILLAQSLVQREELGLDDDVWAVDVSPDGFDGARLFIGIIVRIPPQHLAAVVEALEASLQALKAAESVGEAA